MNVNVKQMRRDFEDIILKSGNNIDRLKTAAVRSSVEHQGFGCHAVGFMCGEGERRWLCHHVKCPVQGAFGDILRFDFITIENCESLIASRGEIDHCRGESRYDENTKDYNKRQSVLGMQSFHTVLPFFPP